MNRVLLLSRVRPGLRLSLALLLALALLASSFAATPATAQVIQDTEQEGESGEADLSGEALQSGDNSNQCVGAQEVVNTGNAQNAIDVLFWTPARDQYGPRHFFFFFDDIEFEEVGSDITVSPTNTTDCTQRVNQAASAASAVSPWYWDGYQWLYWTGYNWAPTYWDGYQWLYWDGYNWVPTWSLVSNVAAGALGAASGTVPLVTLGALALIGTAGLVFRRNRGRDD